MAAKSGTIRLATFFLVGFISAAMAFGQETEKPNDFLPKLENGKWVLDWADEFSGTGMPKNWYPFIASNKEEYAKRTEKGLRWAGGNENTAAMYSTKTGNHWLDGEGNLVIQAVTDKTQTNALGQKVKTAYLMTGYPGEWDKKAPKNKPRAVWEGKFVSPKESPLYITARIRTNEVVGHSTWFAFWLFSKTRAYNDNPVDGTEVDIVEIAKGNNGYMDTAFNVANHWNQTGGSESLQLNTLSKPPATEFVDVTDDKFHVYGLEWTTTYMKCYVDGKLYYTFTENIPSDPVDMMMLLTLEYQKNLWDRKAGDGRNTGPFIEDNAKTRVMSRAYIDYVHVWKKQEQE